MIHYCEECEMSRGDYDVLADIQLHGVWLCRNHYERAVDTITEPDGFEPMSLLPVLRIAHWAMARAARR